MFKRCLEVRGNDPQQLILFVYDSMHVVSNNTQDSSHSAREEEISNEARISCMMTCMPMKCNTSTSLFHFSIVLICGNYE